MTHGQSDALKQEMDSSAKISEAGAELYADRRFQRRVGLGIRPAVIHINMSNV